MVRLARDGADATLARLRAWLDEYEYAVSVSASAETMARIEELERLIVAAVPALLPRVAAGEAVVEAARAVAEWLPGVWGDYRAACSEWPDDPIPVGVEDLIHAVQARGFTLRDVLAAYDAAAADRAAGAGVRDGE